MEDQGQKLWLRINALGEMTSQFFIFAVAAVLDDLSYRFHLPPGVVASLQIDFYGRKTSQTYSFNHQVML